MLDRGKFLERGGDKEMGRQGEREVGVGNAGDSVAIKKFG